MVLYVCEKTGWVRWAGYLFLDTNPSFWTKNYASGLDYTRNYFYCQRRLNVATLQLLSVKIATAQITYYCQHMNERVVGRVGFEPTTPAMSRRYLNQARPPALYCRFLLPKYMYVIDLSFCRVRESARFFSLALFTSQIYNNLVRHIRR